MEKRSFTVSVPEYLALLRAAKCFFSFVFSLNKLIKNAQLLTLSQFRFIMPCRFPCLVFASFFTFVSFFVAHIKFFNLKRLKVMRILFFATSPCGDIYLGTGTVLRTVCKPTFLVPSGPVALSSPYGRRRQLLHRGSRPRGHAPPGHGEGPVRAQPRRQGPHHGAGPRLPGDRSLQGRCVQQGQRSHGLLRAQEVSLRPASPDSSVWLSR